MTSTITTSQPACINATTPDDFFAYTGETIGKHPPARARRLTRDFCAHCPIRVTCELEGDLREEPGLWGGYWRHQSPTYGYTKTLAV